MLADKDFAKQSQNRAGGQAEDRLLGVHSQIAEKLRAFYTEIQEEEIPSHLLSLLEKLDAAEASGARINLPQAEKEPRDAKKMGAKNSKSWGAAKTWGEK